MKYLLYFCLFVSFSYVHAQNKNFSKGMKFDDNAYKKTLQKAPLTRSMYGNSMPESASMKKWAPTPKSQGQYGTCVAWSSGYCAMTILNSMAENTLDKEKITNNAFSPGFLYKEAKLSGDDECSYGTYINNAMDVLTGKGIVKYADFNTDCAEDIPNYLYDKAKNNTIATYAKIFDISDNNSFKIQAAQKSLSENKPLVIGMKCPDSFSDASGCWSPKEDYSADWGGHAMCVIGYDDNMHGGAFEIQNSWGTWWGNEGYIWIKYEDFANWTKYAYELVPRQQPSKEVDLAGAVKYVLSNKEEMNADLTAGKTYKMKQAYKSGTKFRLYISNNAPAFVYAFGSDATNKTFQIFPHLPTISPALNYSANDVAIPDEDHFIQMDNTIGTDFLCVVYSINPLDIDQIRQKIETSSGTFSEKVKSVLSDKLVTSSELTFDMSKISFKAKSKDKSVVALIVEIPHIP